MFRSSGVLLASTAALALLTFLACDAPLESPGSDEAVFEPALGLSADASEIPPAVRKELAALRRYASPLHSLERAEDAGFDVLITECRDNPPVGGMGYHYANMQRIEGAAPTVLEPEILVYAPKRNGKMGLAAVEYIVPFSLWEGPPPTLFGQTFNANPGDGVWQLHVWLWRHNPAGLFEDWNPAVSCD